MRLTFRRTHFGLEDKDPEEALVDVIAGAFGFLPDLVRPLAKGQPSFDGIEDIRIKLCPEASQQASLIGIAKAWPTPCILLQAQLALKRGETRGLEQGGFDFQERPKEVLRAVQVTPNDAARAANFLIFPNMRIPERSVINRVYSGDPVEAQVVENLSWWESSEGSQLPDSSVLVQARSAWNGVEALVTPLPGATTFLAVRGRSSVIWRHNSIFRSGLASELQVNQQAFRTFRNHLHWARSSSAGWCFSELDILLTRFSLNRKDRHFIVPNVVEPAIRRETARSLESDAAFHHRPKRRASASVVAAGSVRRNSIITADDSKSMEMCHECHLHCGHNGHTQNFAIRPRYCRLAA
jgi:hypothetical protein